MSLNQTYHTWVMRILQWRPAERITRVRNMAQLLTGILESKSVHMSKVATKVVSSATLPSVTRRLSRFLDNPAVRVREWYEPIARDVLQAMAQTVGGLGPEGELVTVGVTTDPLPISPLQLITPGLSVAGHPSGTSRDVEETMHFAVLSGVRAWIEERPLAEAAEAYAAMDEGRARYRMVLTM